MESNKSVKTITNFSAIHYSDLLSWDVKSYLSLSNEFNKKYPLVLFGTFLKKPTINKIKINDKEEYKILGVRSYGKGAYINRIVKGRTLKMREYQQAKVNHLFWCKVDTKNGSFGIITDDLANGVASSNMTFAEIDTNTIRVDFLQLLFSNKGVMSYLDSFVTGTTNRKYIRLDQLLNEIKIPLPSLKEQERIINAYDKKIKMAKELEKESKELKKEIEAYLLEKLGIEKNKIQDKNSKINITRFNHLAVWGVERLLRGGNKSILHSSKYENVKLSNLVIINPRTNLSNLQANTQMSFIPMECISDDYGEVVELRKGVKSQSSGYTKFQNGDLIWAKITPCMQNGKSAIVKGLINGFGYGSTEYHIVRTSNEYVLLDYIYHILRTKTVLNDATNYFTGTAGQQRVPKSYLEELKIPLPPIEVQKSISDRLYEFKSMIKKLDIQANHLRNNSQEEFEKEIFGV